MDDKQSSFVLQKTIDGSDTLYSIEMNESYHSLNGAVQESKHIFIEAGLHQIKKQDIRIFEVGFGTGLNALLTWEDALKNNLNIKYDAIELFSVSNTTIKSLNYQMFVPDLSADAFLDLHKAPWNTQQMLESNCFYLNKIKGDFTAFNFTNKYDLVYFDAFAPDKQPQMWEENLFHKIFDALNDNGIIVTYSAKGEIRRRLLRCGFKVERIPGPPRKREMLRAIKILYKNKE
jgi:tRNA U34 5-methylaminomethyl-2-thiouridine-forming methyltransferase MnmC